MSQPTPYTPTTDFSQQEANNASGRSTVNTASLDAEFANIELTLDQTLTNIQQIQRDDGKLKDLVCEVHALSPEVLNLIGGFRIPGNGTWQPSTAYQVNDLASDANSNYVCITAHTSGASFDSSKWTRFGFTAGTDIAASLAAAQASATAAANSATTASNAATSAGNSATSATASASAASASASDASISAGSASSSATLAANYAAQIASTVPATSGNAGKVLVSTGSGTAWGNATGQSAQSMVRLGIQNGFGSTNTAIRRFSTTVTNQGSDVTYADSASLGASFTINKDGVYAINYVDCFTTGSIWMGVSINASSLTSNANSLSHTELLTIANTAGANLAGSCSWTGYLTSGSVLRAHSQAGLSAGSGSNPLFSITRVS